MFPWNIDAHAYVFAAHFLFFVIRKRLRLTWLWYAYFNTLIVRVSFKSDFGVPTLLKLLNGGEESAVKSKWLRNGAVSCTV